MSNKHWSEVLSCSCGKTFRSIRAEARHRHNFPLLCKPKKVPAAIRVLRRVIELDDAGEEGTLTQEGARVFIDGALGEATSAKVVAELLRWCVITQDYRSGNYVIWKLTSSARAVARRPELGEEIYNHILARKGSFTIENDRIKPL